MSRYSGKIGFAYEEEVLPGEWEKIVTERQYYGDFYKISRDNRAQESTNDKLIIRNEISIVGDPFSQTHFLDIIYATFKGKRLCVTNIQADFPRIRFNIGEVYNGPLPGETIKTS